MIDYDEGEGATNRLVEEEDDEDERDGVFELWNYVVKIIIKDYVFNNIDC